MNSSKFETREFWHPTQSAVFVRVAMTVGLTCMLCMQGFSKELKIGSWNIANLAQEPGVALRGHIRTNKDYETIRSILSKQKFDIIALQEIGSIAAAKAILPPGYAVHFEQRCLDNKSQCKKDVGDIFTAIAWNPKSVTTLEKGQITGLDVLHQSECTTVKPRHVRGSPFIRFIYDNKRYIVPSLHLKASCSKNRSESRPDLLDDCQTQRRQVQRILEWAGEPAQSGHYLIFAGDWNRELLTNSDRIRQLILSSFATAKFEPQNPRICWTDHKFNFGSLKKQAREDLPEVAAAGYGYNIYSPKSANDIDFFVIINTKDDIAFSSEQISMGKHRRLDRPGNFLKTCPPSAAPKPFDDNRVLTFTPAHPSDHCPISLTIRRK